MSFFKKTIFGIIIAGIIGLVFFLILYSEILNPTYTAWMLDATADPTQHYLGWIVYQNADWAFPIGVATNYGYPVGVPITYTDSIPLLAIIFKSLNHFLPDNFHYFGLWLLICFALQAVFGYLLIKRYTHRQTISIIGSVLFLLSPIMLFRTFALAGHWLILAGLWLLLKKHNRIQFWQWTLLLFISLMIHPYLFFMNGFLMVADVLMLLKDKKIKISSLIVFLAVQFVMAFLTAYLLGLFMAEKYASAQGFGSFSMNINALVNPDQWSILLNKLPLVNEFQMEGFNYLGVGILFLFSLSLIVALIRQDIFKLIKKHWPIFAVCLVLSLLAISNVVTFNSRELIRISLPSGLLDYPLSLIRSSGRMFWPVFYVILLFSFYILKRTKLFIALIILIFAITLQAYDISPKLKKIDVRFENRSWDNPIVSNDWIEITKDYNHISFLPTLPLDNYKAFVLYAVKNNMTINNGLFAREIKDLRKYIEQDINDVKNQNYQADKLYVFSQDIWSYIKDVDQDKHLILVVDSTFILAPYYKQNYPDKSYLNLEYKPN